MYSYSKKYMTLWSVENYLGQYCQYEQSFLSIYNTTVAIIVKLLYSALLCPVKSDCSDYSETCKLILLGTLHYHTHFSMTSLLPAVVHPLLHVLLSTSTVIPPPVSAVFEVKMLLLTVIKVSHSSYSPTPLAAKPMKTPSPLLVSVIRLPVSSNASFSVTSAPSIY